MQTRLILLLFTFLCAGLSCEARAQDSSANLSKSEMKKIAKRAAVQE